MRKFWYVSVTFLTLATLCGAALRGSRAEGNYLRGDYVEARTASVFAGACHYNGELTTTGRDALMAWNVTSGSWDGVNLSGVRALAVVSADANLADTHGARRAELTVDSSATDAQAAALVEAFKSSYAAALGRVVSVRRAPVVFKHDGGAYAVGDSNAALNVEAMPDNLCCKMPQLVWYDPLVPLAGRKVGYTKKATYTGGPAGDAWERAGENGAFYGSFSF
ncbi:MAG TPA: DUF1326 domain-containing protein [Pyrinomonadaceae bacterium]|nr:DUF1326 domain-containing protein [Pyrinomonadaceae bacterium]